MRVDACGYAGLRPAAAVRPAAGQGDRHRRAAARRGRRGRPRPAAPSRSSTSPGCRPTSAQLLAILAHPDGPRRRRPHDAARRGARAGRPPAAAGDAAPLADAGSRGADGTAGAGARRRPRPALAVEAGDEQRGAQPDGRHGRRGPRRASATRCAPATALLVVSAMKMEAVVTAPCAGVVVGVARRCSRATRVDAGRGRRRRSRPATSPAATAARPRREDDVAAGARRGRRSCRASPQPASPPARPTPASCASAAAAS